MAYRTVLIVVPFALVGIIASVLVSTGLKSSEEAAVQARLASTMEQRIASLEQQLSLNFEVLYSLQRHVNLSPEVSQGDFRSVAEDILNRHSNIQALEWIPRVIHQDRERFEASRRGDYPGFEIREAAESGVMHRAAERDEYYPVSIVVPDKTNERAQGFDLASNQVRLATLRDSAKSGELRISGVIQLVQDDDPVNAFLGFNPVYSGDPTTETQRLEMLRGFVLGVYRIPDIVAASMMDGPATGIEMHLMDDTNANESMPLYHHHSRTGQEAQDQYTYSRTLDVIGSRVWSVHARTTPIFDAPLTSSAPILVRVGGIAITFLLAWYIVYINQRNQLLNDLVQERTQELLLSKNEAERAGNAKAEFLANMSHEIRTPLNGIMGITQLLDETKLTSEQQDYMGTIRESSDHLLAVINDILDFSKFEAGKLQKESIDVDVGSLVRGVVDMVVVKGWEKGIDVICKVDPPIDSYLKSDPNRLRQVLLNLVSNALKFTESGSVTVSVKRISGSPEELDLRFSVRDTGIGIPKDTQESIFHAFEQADLSTTREFGGTGLGLAISHRIVRVLGGELEVESTPGEGSEFYFTTRFQRSGPLPKNGSLRKKSDVRQNTVSRTADSSEALSNRGHILVAEDNNVNQKIVSKLLEVLGYSCALAHNGEQAVAMASEEHFDLVLMDCEMPIMDGYEATRVIRSLAGNAGKIAIVALTANAMEGVQEKCKQAGMDDYLSKPLQKMDLEEVLGRYILVNER